MFTLIGTVKLNDMVSKDDIVDALFVLFIKSSAVDGSFVTLQLKFYVLKCYVMS